MADTPNELAKGTSLNDNLALANQNFQALDDENRTKIIKNGSTPVLLMGYQQDGFGTGINYGFKVSKSNGSGGFYDVTTATNSQLAFNSAFNTFKIVSSGTISIPAVTAGTTYFDAVTHNLGYVPAVLAYKSDATPTYYVPLPAVFIDATGANAGKVNLTVYTQVTSSAIYFYTIVPTGFSTSSAFTIRYYLLQETAS